MGALKKGLFTEEGTNKAFEFQFNPEEIQDKRDAVINSVTAPGRTPAYIYAGMGDHTIDFELFFYGANTQELLQKLDYFMTPRMENGVVKYPIVTFSFGGYITVRGFLKGRSRTTSLFFTDLTPKMSRVQVNFVVLQASTLYGGG